MCSLYYPPSLCREVQPHCSPNHPRTLSLICVYSNTLLTYDMYMIGEKWFYAHLLHVYIVQSVILVNCHVPSQVPSQQNYCWSLGN